MFSNLQRGLSLVEMMIAVAVLGVLATLGTVTTSHIVGKSRDQKLISDVATLNRAVVAFTASGGDLSGARTADEVLSVLKLSLANASRMPGFSGSKIDERLSIMRQTPEEATGDGLRAYWNPGSQSFVTAQSGDGAGIKAFTLDAVPPADGPAPLLEPNTPLLYAGTSTWIWDYQDANPTPRTGPIEIPVSETPDTTPNAVPPTTPPGPATATTLLSAPTFSIASGSYPITDFNLPLSLQNPNPPGSSDLYYSVDFGNWQLYTGTIRVAPGAIVAAQAIPKSDLYRSSRRVDQNYAALPANLLPPLIIPSRPEFGLFTGRELTVTLSNPNPSSISRIEYRIGGTDEWKAYTGPFTLDRDDNPSGALVEARSVPIDPNYIASTETLRTLGVETPSIAGTTAGSFSNPTGEKNMITNLGSGGASNRFAWGRDYLLKGEKLAEGNDVNKLKQSSLEFEGLDFNGVSSNERFQLGSLTYYNGSIIEDTGAERVSFTTDLAFLMNGVSQTASFTFDFELINVKNQNDPNNLWADADYVRLGNPVASQILDFNGIKYRFQLEFGNSTSDGIALFDEFHVLESRSATTKVYGTLVEVGSLSFND